MKVKIELSIDELKTIVACCHGYRIPGAETLANKINNTLCKLEEVT